jgi:DNA repair protein RecN (Recombination protein N)
MLTTLRIRNFAVIDEVRIDLGPGLNVLTGETGAGKSIVVGALSLLLGERASSDVVRVGADRASVEGAFEVLEGGAVDRLLDERGVEPGDGVVILRREVAAEGRNRAWINGSPVTASLVGEVGRHLVDLHGQHQHQTLLRGDEQRAILDVYAGLSGDLADARAAHGELGRLQREIEALEARRAEVRERAEGLRFLVGELEEAAIDPAEEDALEAEANRLEHSEELLEISGRLHEAIAGADGALRDRVAELRRPLDRLAAVDAAQQPLLELFDTAYYALEEMGDRLGAYADGVDHDPGRLEEIRRRQDLLFRLKARHGPTLQDVVRTLEEARAELDLLDAGGLEIRGLTRARDEARERLGAIAGRITEARSGAAERLAGEVERMLPGLGMPDGRFEVRLDTLPEIGATGAEGVRFLVALNRGFRPLPLAEVASGGELARVMLALKTVLASIDTVPTLVFDEVDAGIGGETAVKVGERMREVADGHQVLAITHLPQIAARAHRHFHVRKEAGGEVTAASVRILDQEERVEEIARMLGGDATSETSLRHASELLRRPVAT